MNNAIKSNSAREENPFSELAEKVSHMPGMYLIALRAHVRRGQKLIVELIDTVANTIPGQNVPDPFGKQEQE